MNTSRRASGDEGSALLIAIVFIGVMGLVLAAVLSFAGNGLVTASTFKDHRNANTYLAGAVDTAISDFRGSLKAGAVGSTACNTALSFGTSGTTSGVVDGHTYSVECTPMPGSGGTPDDQPTYAILTLRQSGESLHLGGNSTLTVDGGIAGNGDLGFDNSSSGKLNVFGDVTQRGTCDATRITTTATNGAPSCSSSNALVTDPGYTSVLGDLSTLSPATLTADPTPTCASSSSVVVFTPGYYTSPPAAPSGCNGNLWWFQPPSTGGAGAYYFDFQDGTTLWAPPSNKLIVGGASTTMTASTVASSVTLPGACDTTTDGVQFIFGGASQLQLAPNNGIEICPPRPAHTQQIAIYGVPSGTRSSSTQDKNPGTVTSTTVPPFAPTTSMTSIDGSSGTAALTSLAKVATATFGNFGSIPSGSKVSAVKITTVYDPNSRIDHTISYTLGGSAQTVDLDNSSLCTRTTDPDNDERAVCDISSQLPANQAYRDFISNSFSVDFTSTLANSETAGTATIDGLVLSLTYASPSYEQSCNPTSCGDLLANNPQGSSQNMWFHGTVYMPASSLNVSVQSGGTTVFERGVVADKLTVNASASSKQQTSPFRLPKGTNGRSVLFVGKIDGVVRLRAVVNYTDYVSVGGINTAFPGRQVSIQSWSVVR